MNSIESKVKIYQDEKRLNLTIEGFNYSPTNMLIHLERIKGLKVIAKKSWFLTDDFEAFFTFKGYVFVLYTPFAEIEVETHSKGVPREVTLEVFEHVKNYKIVWLHHSVLKGFKYFFLPFNPNTNKPLNRDK